MLEAQRMQASSKKGGDQYQKVIDQYSQQLQQLQNQQQKTIDNLNEQLTVLRAPRDMQELLGTVEQIVKQYQQFEGAARNARELADANEYLVRSIQNYEDNLETQLAEDNQKAIQDALQLNDLLQQRTDLVNQLAEQEMAVLTRGVLVRQPTRAMTAGAEIQRLEVEAQKRLDALNMEITVVTHRVEAENRIFQLATTRVDLETQLLISQNRQTDKDMARIVQLRDFVQSLPNVVAALGAAPPGTAPADLVDLMERLIGGAYQDRVSIGYATFRGHNI
jgi:hypothetical protein